MELLFLLSFYGILFLAIWLGGSLLLWGLWNLLVPHFFPTAPRIGFFHACGLVLATRLFDWLFQGRSGQLVNILAGGAALRHGLAGLQPAAPAPLPGLHCPHCRHRNPARALHCNRCGKPLAALPPLNCSRCHAPLPTDARFCGGCGTPVT